MASDIYLCRFVEDHLREMEADPSISSRPAAYRALRALGLDDFGSVLWRMPMPAYPRLSSVLPAMASDEVTKSWTGNHGHALLLQSSNFVRSCADNFTSITGTTLRNRKILDFGCGYGRFLRLFSFFTDDIVGVDAWEMSLEHSRQAGFADIVFKSEEVPQSLPLRPEIEFAFAFSIFTHLSERSTLACLGAIRSVMVPGGVLAITIRPVEYWPAAAHADLASRPDDVERMLNDHTTRGFAFLPHFSREDYGDTSLTLDWLRENLQGWTIEAMDRSVSDGLQRYIFLKAV